MRGILAPAALPCPPPPRPFPPPAWSMLKKAGCMTQYWNPDPSTPRISPCSSAVNRMPTMADICRGGGCGRRAAIMHAGARAVWVCM